MPVSSFRLIATLLLALSLGCATARDASSPEDRAQVPAASPAPTPAAPPMDGSRVVASATFAAVGDLLMHGAVKEAAKGWDVRGEDGSSLNNEGYDALFEEVAERLRDADLAFANLETPIAPKTDRGSRPFVFNAPLALLPALKEAGIGIVSFANNHVYDQGRPGFVETLESLDAADLPYVGAGRSCREAASPRLLEVNGIRAAFIGATRLFNDDQNRGPDEACAFFLDEAILEEQIRGARAQGAEVVILSIHWGVEYETAPRQQEIDLAHRLLDAGADVILGHHPHVLQPIEVYPARDGRTTFVAYSLGNFVSNQSRTYTHGVHPEKMGNTRDGVILRFRAIRRAYPNGAIRTELADLVAEPLWTENNAVERNRAPKLAPRIRVIHSDTALAGARASLAAEMDEEKAVELYRRIELLQDRRRLAGQILGSDFLP